MSDIATAVATNGVTVHDFADGSAMVALDDLAMHLNPAQAETLRLFVRVFDKHRAPSSILDEAREIVNGDREATHGEPAKNLQAIASMWAPIFGVDVTPEQVCLAMIALKVARAVNQPRHRDHWIDIVGYCALAERVGYVTAKEAP